MHLFKITFIIAKPGASRKVYFFEACVLYFVKATVGRLGENGLSLTAGLQNTSSQQTNFEKNLFWILPGKMALSISLSTQ